MRWVLTAAAAVGLLFALPAGGGADVVGGANVRASFNGWINPTTLPRHEVRPIALHLRGRLRTTDGQLPPQLRRVEIAVNRFGRVSTAGLPRCSHRTLLASTSRDALRNCGHALVGRGSFAADIQIPTQAPFPATGRTLIFNGISSGRHVLLAHIYGTDPIPTSQVLRIRFRRPGEGTFGTRLTIEMPQVAEDWGHVSAFDLELERRYRYRGAVRSVVSASCPAPAGMRGALFTAARGTYHLADGRRLSRIVTGRCRVGDQ